MSKLGYLDIHKHFGLMSVLYNIVYNYVSMKLFRRTLTAVHDAILEDLTFPAEIVGKRIRIKLDGSRLIKVHLDKTQQTNIEHKVGFSDKYVNLIFC